MKQLNGAARLAVTFALERSFPRSAYGTSRPLREGRREGVYSVSARASGNGLQRSSLPETPGWAQQQLIAMKQLNGAARLSARDALGETDHH